MPTTTTSSGLNNLAMTGSSAPLFFEIFREVDKAESKETQWNSVELRVEVSGSQWNSVEFQTRIQWNSVELS